MSRKWIVAALLGAIVASISAWRLHGGAQAQSGVKTDSPALATSGIGPDFLRYSANSPQLTMIQVQAIKATRLPVTDALNARVVYDEDATVRIGVAISGRVVKVLVAPGDNVKAGQALAEIDSPDVGTASADLNKARADEERKKLTADRARELVPGEAIPLKDWEAAQADLAQARAETARAEQRLKNLNPQGLVISGQRLTLLSPISGVVAERNVTTALEVSPGMAAPLFVITDATRLWLMIDLPEKLLAAVKLGSAVEVESDAYPDQRFPAKLVQLGQVIDPNSRRVTLRAKLDNPGRKLLPEMFVRARLLQDGGEGIRVPNGAIVNRGLATYVFVETAASEFHLRRVTLLAMGSDFSYVATGLRSDERVVTSGALLLDGELAASAGSKS